MALEDTFLLSRLLEDPNRSLSDAFEKFDQIRRPRVDETAKLAARNVQIRKKTGPWGLWLKEQMIWMYSSVSSTLGMDTKWGSGQKHLVYDIDEAEV
jgi:2-polyprenyl-6-methoxyphenol hydroxylase-like FAD-dependent oxidoreductase